MSTRQLKCTHELLDDVKRGKEVVENGRQMSLSLVIAEGAIRQRLEVLII